MKLIDKLADEFNNGLHEKNHVVATNQAAYRAGFLKAREMAERIAREARQTCHVQHSYVLEGYIGCSQVASARIKAMGDDEVNYAEQTKESSNGSGS